MDRQGGRAARSRREMGRRVQPREGRHDLSGVLPPDVGQDDRAVHAVKKQDAELLFEETHLMAYRRRRDREVVCCKCERTEAGGRLKRLNCLDGDPPEHCTNRMSSVHL